MSCNVSIKGAYAQCDIIWGIRRRERVICVQRRTLHVWRWLRGKSKCDKMTDRKGHGGIIKREQKNSSKVWWMPEMWQYAATAALLHWSVLIRDKDNKHKTRVYCELNTPTESSVQFWLKVRKENEFYLGKTKTICTDMLASKLNNMLGPYNNLMQPKYLTNCSRRVNDFLKSYG
jgi:hypothetical protein